MALRRIDDPQPHSGGNSTPPGMKKVCAWCKEVIRGGPDEPTTHGICRSCLASLCRQLNLPLWNEIEDPERRGRRG